MGYSGSNNTVPWPKRGTAARPTIGSTAIDIVAAPARGGVMKLEISNPNSGAVFVKLYDMAAADLNAEITASLFPIPLLEVQVPGGGYFLIIPGVDDRAPYFSIALSIRCVGGFADSDVSSAGTQPHVNVETSQQTT